MSIILSFIQNISLDPPKSFIISMYLFIHSITHFTKYGRGKKPSINKLLMKSDKIDIIFVRVIVCELELHLCYALMQIFT